MNFNSDKESGQYRNLEHILCNINNSQGLTFFGELDLDELLATSNPIRISLASQQGDPVIIDQANGEFFIQMNALERLSLRSTNLDLNRIVERLNRLEVTSINIADISIDKDGEISDSNNAKKARHDSEELDDSEEEPQTPAAAETSSNATATQNRDKALYQYYHARFPSVTEDSDDMERLKNLNSLLLKRLIAKKEIFQPNKPEIQKLTREIFTITDIFRKRNSRHKEDFNHTATRLKLEPLIFPGDDVLQEQPQSQIEALNLQVANAISSFQQHVNHQNSVINSLREELAKMQQANQLLTQIAFSANEKLRILMQRQIQDASELPPPLLQVTQTPAAQANATSSAATPSSTTRIIVPIAIRPGTQARSPGHGNISEYESESDGSDQSGGRE